MDLDSILKLIKTASDLTSVVVAQVDQTKTVLASQDAEAVEEALATLRTQNDRLHARLQEKLRAASQR